MSAAQYKIVFNGQILEGQDPVRVRQNLMVMFKLSEPAIDKLFSGARIVIKKELNEEAAKKYQLAFKKAGAICIVEQETVVAPAPEPESEQESGHVVAEKGDTLTDTTIAEAGSVIMEYQAPEEPDINISSLSMGEAGEVIMEHPEIDSPHIDTGTLDVEPVGVELDSTAPPPEPEIETSHLSAAPAGQILSTSEDIKKPDIDVSSLSLEK